MLTTSIMDRDKIVQYLIPLLESKQALILEYATNTGKSGISIKLAEAIKAQTVYIVVAEQLHIKNWEHEIQKFQKEGLSDKVTIFCYHSLSKYANTQVDLLICDEAHHISEARGDILSTINAKKVIALTGTLPVEVKYRITCLWPNYKLDKITIDTIIQEKIAGFPTIHLVPTELDDIEKKCFFNKKVYTTKELYAILSSKISAESEKENKQYANILGLQRKRLMSEAKTTSIDKLLEELKDSRVLCFCGSIEQTEILKSKIRIPIVSTQTKKEAQELFDKFNFEEINIVLAVNKLREGVNINKIEVVIISSFENTSKGFFQMLGRAVRNLDGVDIILLYAKNTKEEFLILDYLNSFKEKKVINYATIRDFNLKNV